MDRCSTSLEPPETNLPDSSRQTPWGTILTSDDPPITYRHSSWKHERKCIRQALVDANVAPRTLARFDMCGSDPWVAVNPNDPTDLTLIANHCHSRWCLPCNRARSFRIAENLRTQLVQQPHRFLTLTLRASSQPLSQQLDRLYDCFRQLRRQPLWKRCVTGGAAVLEVKRSWHANHWHPHLHVVCEGKYMPQADISADWYRITHDSFVVDIRFLRNTNDVAHYVTKYVTKPWSRNVINRPTVLAELVSALRGRRLVLTFGSWRGLVLTRPLEKRVWTSLCPLDSLIDRASQNNADAKLTLAYLLKCVPDALRIAGRALPQNRGP